MGGTIFVTFSEPVKSSKVIITFLSNGTHNWTSGLAIETCYTVPYNSILTGFLKFLCPLYAESNWPLLRTLIKFFVLTDLITFLYTLLIQIKNLNKLLS
jgi:hypothetical protein